MAASTTTNATPCCQSVLEELLLLTELLDIWLTWRSAQSSLPLVCAISNKTSLAI
jgi:hypothetical protein